MSWARIHRPKQISGLHLTSVKETLLQFMERGEIPQALLFAGPKGTGKTSAARIIGAMLNDPVNEKIVNHQFFAESKPKKFAYQEPNTKTDFNQRIYRGQSFVVQEMDAASNRGIDDIRQLKERVALPPQEGKMTVYILDEAHMLTTAAFNALLKLLEEPPAHVVFILATTELHKIPATIKSRCSLVRFHQANREELMAALTDVLDQEKVEYEADALEIIAERADGSFRDGVKLLQMVVKDGQITQESVETVLSSSVTQDIEQLLTYLLDKDETAVTEMFVELRRRNVDEDFFNHSLLSFLHRSLLQSLGVEEGKAFTERKIAQFLLQQLSSAVQEISPLPHLNLELAMLDIIDRAKQQQGSGGSSGAEQFSNQATPTNSNSKKKSKKANHSAKAQKPKVTSSKSKPTISNGDSQKLLKNWSKLLSEVKKYNMTLEALLRSAKPLKGQNGTAKVAVYYKFHKEQLELPRFKEIISRCAEPLAGGQVKLEYLLKDLPNQAELKEAGAQPDEEDLAALAEEVLS